MKKYYSRTETPLIFHKIYWYVILPLGFLGGLGNLFRDLSEYASSGEILASLITVSLSLACFIGFFDWKPYAWYCLIIKLSLTTVAILIVAVLQTIVDPDLIAYSTGEILAALAIVVPIGIYYIKRRSLFIQNAQNPASPPAYTASGYATYIPAPQAKFCRQCGFTLLPDSDFCSQCGTPVAKDNQGQF